jgi:hypothetical protein
LALVAVAVEAAPLVPEIHPGSLVYMVAVVVLVQVNRGLVALKARSSSPTGPSFLPTLQKQHQVRTTYLVAIWFL